jgi:membrane-bound lytic murein transglycosylase B
MLLAVEEKTGVPEYIMMAIYGHETGCGTFTGHFDLLNLLGTLAFEGRRRARFAGEFLKTLPLMQRGVPRSQLKGSWAGATGNPQFLPSVYLRLGTDGDGDGKVDIWKSELDTLASIDRYLQDAGWKASEPSSRSSCRQAQGAGKLSPRVAADQRGSAQGVRIFCSGASRPLVQAMSTFIDDNRASHQYIGVTTSSLALPSDILGGDGPGSVAETTANIGGDGGDILIRHPLAKGFHARAVREKWWARQMRAIKDYIYK